MAKRLNMVHREDGSIVVMSLWLAIFVALSVGVVTIAITHNSAVIVRKRALSVAVPGADAALNRYIQALNDDDVGDHTNYQLTYGALLSQAGVRPQIMSGEMLVLQVGSPLIYGTGAPPATGGDVPPDASTDDDFDADEVPPPATGNPGSGTNADVDADPPPPVDEDTPEDDESTFELPSGAYEPDDYPWPAQPDPIISGPDPDVPGTMPGLNDELRTLVRRRVGAVQDPPASKTDFIVVQKVDDGVGGAPPMVNYWQIYRVDPPSVTNMNDTVIVYIRSWSSNADGTLTEPRYIRAHIVKPSFTRYQILGEEEVSIGDNAVLRANIHSNTKVTNTGGGTVSCLAGARLSAPAFGAIPPSCPAERTSERIELGSVERTFRDIRRMSPSARAQIVQGATNYRVRLSGTSVSIRNADTGAALPAVPIHPSGTAVLFYGREIKVSGSIAPGYSVTIASWNPDTQADIVVLSTAAAPSFGSAGSTIGLIAQGNVYLGDSFVRNCSSMRAAVIAEYGTMGIMPTWRSDIWQSQTPRCNSGFNLTGSLAVRRTPAMRLEWGSKVGGYDVRNYNYDVGLRTLPPPLFPRISPWHVATWEEADKSCLPMSADPTCTPMLQ